MAPARSRHERDETAAFIERLYEAGGYATWSEFARDARVHPVQLSKWKNGEAEPMGMNLVRLVAAANARAGGDTTVSSPVTLADLLEGQRAAAAALEQVSASVDELAAEVASLHAELASVRSKPGRSRRAG